MTGLERYIGEVLDEKYRLNQLLGQGGMGAVYLATHLGTERPVALKLIAPQFMRNEEFVERFKREARAAGRLRHPNVVDVTDFGFARTDAGRVAYLVMEYLDGCTLADVLEEESRLPIDWVVDILEQVCSAVDEAHQQGIVHRDLKPDNIWLEPNRLGGYRIKVLDFGIAKLAETSAPQTNANAATQTTTHTLATASHAPPPPTDTVHTAQAQASSVPVTRSPSNPIVSEAATQLYPAPASVVETEDDQAGTLLLPQAASTVSDVSGSEAATRIQTPASNDDGDRTQLLNRVTEENPNVRQTAAASSLTRVGSIMGTPLYMSPEQCRGEHLDARSDIYSLGVIAYQMLAGETPFAGDMAMVLKSHMNAPPPPLKDKNRKLSKRVARSVVAALAKNPAERPASAAAFASSLRANADGVGSLLRHAFALFSEHFPIFLRISLLAHLPLIVLSVIQITNDLLTISKRYPRAVGIGLSIVLSLMSFVASFLATSIISGLTVFIVTQLNVAPLRPVELSPAIAVLKKRLRPFLVTSMLLSLRLLIGFILCIIPGFVIMVRYTLFAPVVLMEGLEKRAALKRARALMRRDRRTVISVVFISFLLPFLVGAVFGLFIKVSNAHAKDLSVTIIGRLPVLINIIIVPLISIMSALLYLKMRQLGGETLKETLEQFEVEDVPRSRWQQRMRTRLTINTPHTPTTSRSS